MRRKTRQALFWSCFFVFTVVSPVLVLYARGYRFDFIKRRFVATGAIFIKSESEGGIIYVDGVRRGYTPGVFEDVIAKPSLISNILPGEHDIRVEKVGYVPWAKKLAVRPREVTEARSILLFADPEPRTLYYTPISDALTMHSGEESIVLYNGSATSWITAIKKGGDAHETLYAETLPKDKSKYPHMTLEAFSPDDKLLLVKKERQNETPTLFTILLDTKRVERMPAYPAATDAIRKAAFGDSEHVVFLDTRHTMRQWKPGNSDIPQPISTSAWGFAVYENTIYTLEGDPQMLFVYTADGVKKSQVTAQPLNIPLGPVDLWVETLADSTAAFLVISAGSQNGTVRLVKQGGAVTEVQKEAESFNMSPDKKKMLIKTWNELWVHYFDDILVQPVRKKGDRVLVARFGTGVKEARWHPMSGDYVLYTVPDGLFATELDDRGGKRNTVQLVRNGDIVIRAATRKGLFFTAQEHLAYVSWKLEE